MGLIERLEVISGIGNPNGFDPRVYNPLDKPLRVILLSLGKSYFYVEQINGGIYVGEYLNDLRSDPEVPPYGINVLFRAGSYDSIYTGGNRENEFDICDQKIIETGDFWILHRINPIEEKDVNYPSTRLQ